MEFGHYRAKKCHSWSLTVSTIFVLYLPSISSMFYICFYLVIITMFLGTNAKSGF